jgi:hypothetical protein
MPQSCAPYKEYLWRTVARHLEIGLLLDLSEGLPINHSTTPRQVCC